MKKIKLLILVLLGSTVLFSCSSSMNESFNTQTTDELAEKVFTLIEYPTQWSKQDFINAFISYDKLCEIYKSEATEEGYKNFIEDFPSEKEYKNYLSEIFYDDFTLTSEGENQLSNAKCIKISTSFDELEKMENGLMETTGEIELTLPGEQLSVFIDAIYYEDRYWLTELDLY